MDLILFHERIYGKYQNQLFLFEPSWDSFRPVSGIGWNGKQFVPIDDEYKKDLFDEFYGYGSIQMKTFCEKLLEETELDNAKEVLDPVQVWSWYKEKNTEYWKDRLCMFTSPCVSRDTNSWKKYLNYLGTRRKTLKNHIRRMLTRKNRISNK